MRGGVVYCNACGSHNNPGLKKCSTCGTRINPQGVRTNPITTAEFANRKMAVFDLDMTILDNRQRFTDAVRAGVINKDGSPKQKGGWKKRGEFLYEPTRLMKDKLMPNAMNLIEHLMEEGYMIAYCTARPITYYEVTKDQLEDKGLPIFQDASGADLLFCKRSIGQKTPLYKADVIRTLQAQYDVRLFFDDMPDNLSSVLKEDVPGVYQTIGEYYDMIKGVKKNPYPTFVDEKGFPRYDPDAEPYASAASHSDDPTGLGREMLRVGKKNPSMMYSPMDLERAYESIKGTKIQTNPGPKGEMCGSCVYMCMSSGKCKKWSEMKGSPVYVASGWYCKAYKAGAKKNPIKRGSDSKGSYYRWGKNQKYYYKTGSKTSRENARKKAYRQAQAAFAGGYRGNPHDEVVGKHCILELYDCDPKLLDDEKFIHKTMKSAAKGANMQFLDFVSHEFEPQGVTALALLGESHMSIHTWPELGYAMVDVLTCGEKSKPADACEIICDKLKAKNHTLKFFMRESPAYRRMARQNPEAYSEDYMVPRDIDKLGKAADSMEATYHDGMEVPEWWKSKLSVTADKADNLSDALSYVADNPRSNPPKSKVEKGKELYKHMNGKAPAKTETKVIDIGDVWYQVGEGGCWQIGYMSGKETGSSSQKYVHHFNEETKNGDFPKLYATIPDKGKPMLIITGGTWKIKTDEEGIAWIYD